VTDHAGFLELAARQIDFDLTPVDAARLEAHLAACATCRLKVERLRADSTALRSFGWYDAPATLEDVVMTAALHGRGRSAPRPWVLGFAAALALVVLAGGALGGGSILEGLLVGARPTSPAPSLPASAEAPSVAPTAVQGGSPAPRPSGLGPAIRTPTAATVTGTPAPTGGTIAVAGSLLTLGGDPIAGASVALSATQRDGLNQVLEFSGTVPADAQVALIAIGANAEGVGPGPADITFYEVGYSEGGDGVNLVPYARFDRGLLGWDEPSGDGSLTVVPSDLGSGSMLRMVVTPDQWLYSASGSFPVTPGAAFRTWAAVRVPEASIDSAYIAPRFFTSDWKTEVRRDTHPLGPVPIALGSAVTDATGAFALTLGPLEPGRYLLLAEWAGNATYWPGRAQTEVTVP
jgi:hypothetical protein